MNIPLRRSRALRVGVVAVLTLAVAVAFGARLRWAFDTERRIAAAAELTQPSSPQAATEIIAHELDPPEDVTEEVLDDTSLTGASEAPKEPPSGDLLYRPNQWLSVINLHDLPPVPGEERYLVFLRSPSGWTLAGATDPGRDGEAQVRFSADPRPASIFEVLVTRDVDDADSSPHGDVVLHWMNPDMAALGITSWLPYVKQG